MGPMAEAAGELGIRLYTSPGYASAHHYFDQGGRHRMQWDEAAGVRGLVCLGYPFHPPGRKPDGAENPRTAHLVGRNGPAGMQGQLTHIGKGLTDSRHICVRDDPQVHSPSE